MAEANSLHIYKNATLQGEPIPFDILLSSGLIKQDFTATAANAIDLPNTAPIPEILVVYADDTAPCLIQLNGNAAIPGNGDFTAGLHFIPAGCIKVIDRNGATTFGIISYDGNAGTVIIECAYNYKDARNPQQHRRS